MTEQNPKSVEEMAAKIKADHDAALDSVKATAVDALGKAEAGEKLAEAQKQAADEALTKLNELTEQVKDMDQKLERAKAFEKAAGLAKSLGEQFVSDEAVKDMLSKGTDFRGASVDETRLPGVIAPPNRRMTIRDLIMPGQMDGSVLEYVRETGFNNNAAPVAEGAAKPQSDIQMELVSTSAKVIAHTAKASRQILDDASMMRTYIDGRLRYGLAFREETQLLNGDGTGQNLNGIVPQATAFSAPCSIASCIGRIPCVWPCPESD